MVFSKKWNMRLALFSILAGLIISMALWNGPPTLAQQLSPSFTKVHILAPSVEVRSGAGDIIGNGTFWANGSNNRTGRTNGKAVLQLDEFTEEIEFTAVDDIIVDGEGNPVGAILRGRGRKISDGQVIGHEVTHVVQFLPDGECCLVEILGAEVHNSCGVRFEAEGTLKFTER
jgi:hypothetical protein